VKHLLYTEIGFLSSKIKARTYLSLLTREEHSTALFHIGQDQLQVVIFFRTHLRMGVFDPNDLDVIQTRNLLVKQSRNFDLHDRDILFLQLFHHCLHHRILQGHILTQPSNLLLRLLHIPKRIIPPLLITPHPMHPIPILNPLAKTLLRNNKNLQNMSNSYFSW
jgi:hypothetical protein